MSMKIFRCSCIHCGKYICTDGMPIARYCSKECMLTDNEYGMSVSSFIDKFSQRAIKESMSLYVLHNGGYCHVESMYVGRYPNTDSPVIYLSNYCGRSGGRDVQTIGEILQALTQDLANEVVGSGTKIRCERFVDTSFGTHEDFHFEDFLVRNAKPVSLFPDASIVILNADWNDVIMPEPPSPPKGF